MSDKKHIDRLFQEGFKDFEAVPNDAVWKNIEAQLNEKKKKRRVVIPIWWRYAGVAALLLLLLTIGGIVLNNPDEGSINQVVDTETTHPEKTDIKDNTPLKDDVTETITVASDNNSENNLTNNSSSDSNKASNPKSKIITDKVNNPSKETSIAKTSASKNQNERKTGLTSSDKLYTKKKIVNPKNKSAITNNNPGDKNNVEKLQNKLEHNTGVAKASKGNDIVGSENASPLVDKEQAKKRITEASNNNTAIADVNSKTVEETKSDNNSEENKRSIEDALNTAKDVIEEDNNNLKNRWSIAPNVAPVYFNTLKDGSSIDPQFNNNAKSGDINMSYGISASYAINKKLSMRSGIHSVNLGYNTDDVLVFQSLGVRSSSNALQNINSASNNVSFISSKSLNSDTSSEIASSNATINQNLRYIEIPLEIQYTLSDKKLGVNLIGGFSSFFLNTSKVFYEEDNGNRTILGEASNINKMSYSANFGLGLNYKVTKKFDFNLEPIFKYQFNTFNNTSGNFSPFFIGVYTGFAIKF